jgi:2-keto-4-pentenoate hydratase/2-oxohepta-3-ene-1,7-dioic acid hydratase in catechol pathway
MPRWSSTPSTPGASVDLPAPGALCRYADGTEARVGLLTADGVLPTELASILDGIVDGSLAPDLARLAGTGGTARLDPETLSYLPPVDPRTMLYVGRNYDAHLAENPRPRQDAPVFFSKLVSSLIGHGQPIRVRPGQHVDYEGELAIVIGRTIRGATAATALDAIAGYTIANDVSDRAVQHVNHQITMGKGPDTFGPLGPFVVPRVVIGDGSGLRLRTWVRDDLRQDDTTSGMIHDVIACVVAATETVTLRPGDVIATGTPAGTGAYRNPPEFLVPGDWVRVAIDGIGELVNPVEAEARPAVATIASP